MKLIGFAGGCFLLFVAATTAPKEIRLWIKGEDDPAYLLGRLSVIVIETALGLLLIFIGVKSHRKEQRLDEERRRARAKSPRKAEPLSPNEIKPLNETKGDEPPPA